MWQPKNILVTGAAGFIGFHLSRKLLDQGCTIAGLDNLNDYYDPNLKQARLDQLTPHPSFTHVNIDLADRSAMEDLFSKWRFDAVMNLAAQAGVRYSLKNPHSYVNTNLVGFLNVLEGCRHSDVQHLIFASSSSVYGANSNMPFSVHDKWTIRSPFTPPAKNPMNSWPTPTAACSVYPAPVCGFYRLRSLGPTGHGFVPVYQGHPGRPAHRRVQPWKDETGFHLYR